MSMISKERRKKQRGMIRATQPKKVEMLPVPAPDNITATDIMERLEHRIWSSMTEPEKGKSGMRLQGGWLYNGTPALCRKCGFIVATSVKCVRDPEHKCELESRHSAEERRLLEVHRRLKATFSEPKPETAILWENLVGLNRR